MLSQVLISFALFVAVQAYSPSEYKASSLKAGYAAQSEPVATVYILPSYAKSYGASPAYGASSAYSPAPAYGASSYGGVDSEVLRLAKLALSLPSAGGPNSVVNKIPQHYSTSYSAPATSNLELPGSGYGPVQAGSNYGSAPYSSY